VTLRRVIDERRDADPAPHPGLIRAVRACADGLAEHEQAPELREFRAAVDAYAGMLEEKDHRKLCERLVTATKKAMPLLDAEAASRKAQSEQVITEEQRAAGLQAVIWPSPDALRKLPRVLLDALPRERFALQWGSKLLHDLALLDADPRVLVDFPSPRIRMTQALHAAGYEPAEIARIVHPFARGEAHKRARNAVAKRLKLGGDVLYVGVNFPSDAPDAAQKWAALGEAARFVAGEVVPGMVAYVSASTESAVASEVPIPPRVARMRAARSAKKSKPKR
jgi:hypothetical protein